MKPVSELFKNRPIALWSVHPDESVFEAIKTLAEKGVGAMMVMEHGRLVGIMSERDYTRKIALLGKNSRETKVREIMTPNVLVVTPSTRTRQCMAIMSEKNIRHLPVMDGSTVVGMISILDLMSDMIADHEFTIAQLESYIKG
jgi:CBS domain-containing protein